jgi:hypothetical protein
MESTSANKSKFTSSRVSRRRWNGLDLVTVVARGSVPCTIESSTDMSWAKSVQKKFQLQGNDLTVKAMLIKAIAIAQQNYAESRSVLLPCGRVAVVNVIKAGFSVERSINERPSLFFGEIAEPEKKSLKQIMTELKTFEDESVFKHPQLKRQYQLSKMPWLVRQFILRLAILIPQIRLKLFGATFELTSLDMSGITYGAGPTVCTSTFGFGAVEDCAVVVDHAIRIRPRMTLSLVFDHRLMDGAVAARFLAHVINLMEGGLEQHLPEEDLVLLTPLKRHRLFHQRYRHSA